MLLRGSMLDVAVRLLLATLTALWPALCCCGFNHYGCSVGTAGMELPTRGHGDHHGAAEGDEHHGGGSGSCHESPDGGCHQDGPDGGCSCQKSSTTLASVDTFHTAPASPILAAAWLPEMSASVSSVRPVERWTTRIERPPPIPLLRLRVLRI
jgi:hypothetical protein